MRCCVADTLHTINSHVGVMTFGVLDAPSPSFSLDGTDEKVTLILCLVSVGTNHIGRTYCWGYGDRIPCIKGDWHSNGLGGVLT